MDGDGGSAGQMSGRSGGGLKQGNLEPCLCSFASCIPNQLPK